MLHDRYPSNRLDTPSREGEWQPEFEPDIEVDQGTLDSLAFGAFMTGKTLE